MKRQRKLAGIALLLTTLTFIGTARGAQKPSQTIGAYGDMVFVSAGVTDAKKEYVSGIRREQFQVYEDGVEQKVTYFTEKGPWNVEMVVGIETLRMQSADRESIAIREALDAFKKVFGQNDQIHIDELTCGSAGLYDAIYKAIEKVSQVANPRKAVVVIADGFDNVAGDPGAQLIDFAKKYNVPVFSMFLQGQAADASRAGGGNLAQNLANGQFANIGDAKICPGNVLDQTDRMVAGTAFRNLADITGGQYLSTDPLHEMEVILKGMATELKNQYVLGYTSTNDAKDNKYRKLKVTLRPLADGTKLNVRTKAEYFVPKAPKS